MDHTQAGTLGLIVNPVAGMGGRVGLKGTDGPDRLDLALARGAKAVAPLRARRALARLRRAGGDMTILAPEGPMGADVAAGAGFEPVVVSRPGCPSTPEDTRNAAAEMVRRGVDLLMFAGGDGTARDICDAVGTGAPVLGVPSGVKMHSGVFAANPEAAGEVAHLFLHRSAPQRWLADVDVADVDEDAIAAGRMSTRLYGRLRAPVERSRMLGPKQTYASNDQADLDALCARIATECLAGHLYVLGPGTTTARILAALGLPATLLGVDAVRDGGIVGRDLSEAGLAELIGQGPATLIAGVVGGQGCLFGRGNQQLSPKIIRHIGRENIVVVAGATKLLSLSPPVLRIDTGDEKVDRMLTGYMRVRVAPNRDVVMKASL